MNSQLDLQKYLEYDLGLILYIFAFASLIYYYLNGKKVHLPGPFFLLTSLGAFFMVFHTVRLNKPVFVVLSRLFIALTALFFYFN